LAAPRRLVRQGFNGRFTQVLSRICRHGALTIRGIEDEMVERDYAWASRKRSKRALEVAFYPGLVTVSQRVGMLKTYELMTRHFGWDLPCAQMYVHTLDARNVHQIFSGLSLAGFVRPEGARWG
jgi:uncharacterized protein YcaQ